MRAYLSFSSELVQFATIKQLPWITWSSYGKSLLSCANIEDMPGTPTDESAKLLNWPNAKLLVTFLSTDCFRLVLIKPVFYYALPPPTIYPGC